MILKSALSAPPVIVKVGMSPSTSVAVTVAIEVWFSAALTAAGEVMTGASFESFTEMVKV